MDEILGYKFFFKKYIHFLLYLLKFNLALIVPVELMNFKLSNIPVNSVYFKILSKCTVTKTKKSNQTTIFTKIKKASCLMRCMVLHIFAQ